MPQSVLREEPAKPSGRDNLFLWTVFLLVLAAVVFACWLGSFYVFGHPENPQAYRLLKKLNKLAPPARFPVTKGPPGEFLEAQRVFERYSKYSPLQLQRENEQLFRNYLRNFSETKKLVPYLTGKYVVLRAYELQRTDLFRRGVVVLTQSAEFPQFLAEIVYPLKEGQSVSEILALLQPGLELKLQRTHDLSAVLQVGHALDGRMQVTVVPLLYGVYGLKNGSGAFALEPPDSLNVGAGFPLVRGEEVRSVLREAARRRAVASKSGQTSESPGELVRVDDLSPGMLEGTLQPAKALASAPLAAPLAAPLTPQLSNAAGPESVPGSGTAVEVPTLAGAIPSGGGENAPAPPAPVGVKVSAVPAPPAGPGGAGALSSSRPAGGKVEGGPSPASVPPLPGGTAGVAPRTAGKDLKNPQAVSAQLPPPTSSTSATAGATVSAQAPSVAAAKTPAAAVTPGVAANSSAAPAANATATAKAGKGAPLSGGIPPTAGMKAGEPPGKGTAAAKAPASLASGPPATQLVAPPASGGTPPGNATGNGPVVTSANTAAGSVPLKSFLPGGGPNSPGASPAADPKKPPQVAKTSRSRSVTTEQASALSGRNDSAPIYLHGKFVVTAAGGNRAVLRQSSESGGKARVIVEYPAGGVPPQQGSLIAREDGRGFEIREVRRSQDGQVNIFVREVAAAP